METVPSRATLDMTVEEAVERWPAVASVFVRCGMACVGCQMAAFETLGDAARAYGMSAARFLAAVRRAARSGGGRP